MMLLVSYCGIVILISTMDEYTRRILVQSRVYVVHQIELVAQEQGLILFFFSLLGSRGELEHDLWLLRKRSFHCTGYFELHGSSFGCTEEIRLPTGGHKVTVKI